MKRIVLLILFFLPSVAFGYVFNECKPMNFNVYVSSDSDIAEDVEQRLSIAVETRLRSARLYSDEGYPSIDITFVLIDTRTVGDRHTGFATAINLEYAGWAFVTNELVVRDNNVSDLEFLESLEFPRVIAAWSENAVTFEPVSEQGNNAIETALEVLDEFILEYLRENEDYCR